MGGIGCPGYDAVVIELDFDNPPADPVSLVQSWCNEAQETGLPNPNAMSLSTVDADGRPSLRMVLLKELDARGAVFYTNFESRKSIELVDNPHAAVLLHWDVLSRQVRIEGTASQVSDAASDAYFRTRPRDSQLGAWASNQSMPIADRRALDDAFREVEERFADADIPRPPHWGGFRISLDRIEIWQGRTMRMHDRIVYTPSGEGWDVQRIAP